MSKHTRRRQPRLGAVARSSRPGRRAWGGSSRTLRGSCRYIVVGPTILETTVDLRGGLAQVATSRPPGGNRLLVTLSSPDKRFEVHVDAARIQEASLTISEKTGRGVMRLLGDDGRAVLTVIPVGDDAEAHFEVLFGRWGSRVSFVDAGEPDAGGNDGAAAQRD